jgi:Aspartyl/Asparaginyl beta-hydroxylase
MNIGINFKYLGKIDPQPMIDAIGKIDEVDWGADTFRQTAYKAYHHATQAIQLIYDKDFRHFNGTQHKYWYDLNMEELIKPVTDLCRQAYGDGYIARAMFVKLYAGKNVERHIDVGGSYSLSHRVHVTLIGEDDKIIYNVRDEDKFFKIGEVWELNDLVEHEVRNQSQSDRINLIMDYATLDGKGWWWK